MMDTLALDALRPWLVVAAGLVGLLIGSFLNVVIYRLPLMMERQWALDCAQVEGEISPDDEIAEPLNLVHPRSRCASCGTPVTWQQNVPLFSYLVLRGRCGACQAAIGVIHPFVELACGLLFAYCVWRWGVSPTALIWCGFSAALLTLACIDWQTTLLPDDITLPLLWGGLLAAALAWNRGVSLSDAVWGAAAGYTFLWLVYQGFKAVTGKDGMGYGDFKLFAALGAWFGWQALLPLILMASCVGAAVGLLLRAAKRLAPGAHMPFGPLLAAAGFVAMFWGPQTLLRWISL